MVSVDFEKTDNSLVISGEDIAHLGAAPLFRAFLRQHSGVVFSPSEIRIPTTHTELYDRYGSLCKILARYGIAVTDQAELSREIHEIKDEEARFNSFSKIATDIWNGNVRLPEFEAFVDTLSSVCPGRTFFRLQVLAAYHLAFSQHACNFSVPGAGKTSIVYAAYGFLKSLPPTDYRHVDHLLIVGPLSAFRVWEDEYKAIFQTRARARRLIGSTPEQERRTYLKGISEDAFSTELTLTSYQGLASLEEEFSTFLGFPRRKVMMILDEAHNIKRPDGVWAGAALRLARKASARVVLTGTPAPNGYEDLENLFEFIHPKRKIIGYPGVALKAMSAGKMSSRVDDLKSRIRPFFTRIKKRDLNLPPTSEETLGVKLSAAHAEIYRAVESLVIPSLRKIHENPRSKIARAGLMRLRQAATNPRLLLIAFADEDEDLDLGPFVIPDFRIAQAVNDFEPSKDLEKLRKLYALVTNLLVREQRILIWSVFVANLELIENSLKGIGMKIDIISGAVPVESDSDLPEDQDIETRERIIDGFLNAQGPAILIANPQSIGESISLHKGCHSAIYYDRDFNAGRFIQSKDRIHRYGLGEEQLTQYHYLMSDGTVEVDIANRLALKERRLLRLIDQDDIPLFQAALGDQEEWDDVRAVLESYERRKAL